MRVNDVVCTRSGIKGTIRYIGPSVGTIKGYFPGEFVYLELKEPRGNCSKMIGGINICENIEPYHGLWIKSSQILYKYSDEQIKEGEQIFDHSNEIHRVIAKIQAIVRGKIIREATILNNSKEYYTELELRQVDKFVKNSPINLNDSVKHISDYFVQQYKADKVKYTRAIFKWIVNNIKYDVSLW